MIIRLIKTYVIVFVLFYLLYTSINWFININGIYTIGGIYMFLLPVSIVYGLSYLIFRPIVKSLQYKKKISDFILWFIIPISLGFSVTLSQDYFIESHFKLIHISKPSDIFKYSNERYFKIDKYYINKNNYYYIYSNFQNKGDLHVDSYFILPIYDDSSQASCSTNIGCGQKIFNHIHYGWFDKEDKKDVISRLLKINENDYLKTDFYNDGYFELVTKSDELKIYLEGWKHHPDLNKIFKPIIIEKKSGTFIDRRKRDFNTALSVTLISFIVAIILMLVSHYFRNHKPDENLM